jgi:hypothetical protein
VPRVLAGYSNADAGAEDAARSAVIVYVRMMRRFLALGDPFRSAQKSDIICANPSASNCRYGFRRDRLQSRGSFGPVAILQPRGGSPEVFTHSCLLQIRELRGKKLIPSRPPRRIDAYCETVNS